MSSTRISPVHTHNRVVAVEGRVDKLEAALGSSPLAERVTKLEDELYEAVKLLKRLTDATQEREPSPKLKAARGT